MVRAEKLLMDVEKHCWTALHTFPLFHVDIRVHVCEHLQEDLIHQDIVDIECINLVFEASSIKAVLTQPEVRFSMNDGSPGDYLLISSGKHLI